MTCDMSAFEAAIKNMGIVSCITRLLPDIVQALLAGHDHRISDRQYPSSSPVNVPRKTAALAKQSSAHPIAPQYHEYRSNVSVRL